MASPRTTSTPPKTPSIRTPDPRPVNDKLLAGAVTAAAVVDEPPLASVVATTTGMVVCEPPPTTAITGFMADPDGVLWEIPVGFELFGNAVQVSANGFPDTSSVRLALAASSTVMELLVAVKGPSLLAGLGRVRVMPLVGTVDGGVGRGSLNETVPPDMLAGLAPASRTEVWAEPARAVFPSAAAADASWPGTLAIVW
jgi:hypothetical protein